MSDILDEDQAYLKRWYKFAKIHKTIASPKKDTHLESICYRIKIRDVGSIQPKKDAQQSIRILLNLYNSGSKEFFGRTYESPFLQLNYSQKFFCYFHLRQIEQIQIAAEIVLFGMDAITIFQDIQNIIHIFKIQIQKLFIQKKEQVIQNRLIIGWCLGEIGQDLKHTLKRGSSRFFVFNQTNIETVGQTLWMEVIENTEFGQIKKFVPEECLCSYGDELLGIHGYQLISQLYQCRNRLHMLPQQKYQYPPLQIS